MGDIVTGLQGRWSCNDAADGVITDSSGNGRDLTVTAAGGFPKRVGAGNREFSQTSDNQVPDNFAQASLSPSVYNSIVGSGNGNSGAFTLSCWYKSNTTKKGKKALIGLGGVGVNADGTPNNQMAGMLFHELDTAYDKIRFTTEASTSNFDPPPTGTWVHLAVVSLAISPSLQQWKLYVNGVLAGTTSEDGFISQAYQGNMPAAPVIRIGKWINASDLTQFGEVGGFLHDVRVYSRALSAGDVADLAVADLPADGVPDSIGQTVDFGSPTGVFGVDPAAISQSVVFGTPRVAPESNLTTGLVSPLTTSNTKSSAAVSTASSNSQAVIG